MKREFVATQECQKDLKEWVDTLEEVFKFACDLQQDYVYLNDDKAHLVSPERKEEVLNWVASINDEYPSVERRLKQCKYYLNRVVLREVTYEHCPEANKLNRFSLNLVLNKVLYYTDTFIENPFLTKHLKDGRWYNLNEQFIVSVPYKVIAEIGDHSLRLGGLDVMVDFEEVSNDGRNKGMEAIAVVFRKGDEYGARLYQNASCWVLSSREIDYHTRIMGVDVGVNNLIMCCSNTRFPAIAVNGAKLKGLNKTAANKIKKAKNDNEFRKVNRARLTNINRAFSVCTNTFSYLVDAYGIDSVIIGFSKDTGAPLDGFGIPLDKLCKDLVNAGICQGAFVNQRQDFMTSETSFLDGEIPNQTSGNLKGKRINRGLFQSADGTIINADVNAAYQIIKLYKPNCFVKNRQYPLHPRFKVNPF